jgi:2-iminobutanoate/2-iminopropanoate deaminase
MIKPAYTDKAPKVVGPYSQAIMKGDMIFCSGQIGIDPQSGELVEGIENQTKQVMKNLEQVLIASGATFQQVVKTTIFITDMNNYTTVNEAYASFFSEHKPARSTVAVAALPKAALVEIEMIAIR